ncbi:zinc-dependent alcohol dehydrogenase family protein [Pseudomonas plecoglossicida]|jgi:NADPH:quinone reductase-like Zn-dependent oxidoreductase|uniref:zinc-dependent alcohol dehydrogenase family protein n=1 Tax=Pseudomonas TaxID=286 RepID=UPI000761F6FD|nr:MULTISPECIES: zinc-dependent alcohol dehydrogenase family protein [Pseudomonas]EKT4502606.1 zinc-dependent alcohol dehydrogenase family protein [Pseudomonas putida]EKT4566571.1 zinc-dependent alcohol dehydrogenase family protein [Pseudomonas putida]MCE1054558.1 zinc-dependent alcohol dehydrogenase family protein [Pseudomonas alloputida]MCE1057238.1 zinc-dependent alcohol dehydrogenase family protein [Pseudomonas alloputida]MCF1250399.1 zinc-dependent alcohol dehydrogenase family protein [Ps
MNQTMLAAIAESAQTPLVVRHIARPVPGKGQVLVRIHAAGVNPLDTKIAIGAGAHARQELPAVLGLDLAGTVVELGEAVDGFTPGQEVFGMAGGIGGAQGTLAEYIAVDARLIASKPHALGMREAAALPLVFITAWEGLVDHANVRSGQRVLIHGGAGGVGQVAVQLAKARGAEVYATGSAGNLDFIRALGATAIDYQTQRVEAYVEQFTAGEGFDIVYDTVGGSTLDASFKAVKPYTGHVLSCLGWGQHSLAPLSFKSATYSGVFTLAPLLTGKGREHHGSILREAAVLANAGQLAIRVDPQQFALDEVNDAFRQVAEGRGRGKTVIQLVSE